MPLSEATQITFEKTPDYFRDANAAKRIYDFNPKIKLLLILRDPVTRCISHFTHNRIKVKDSKPELAKKFEKRILDKYGMVRNETNDEIISPGKYIISYKQWLKFFPKEQILVLDGENFIIKPFEELQKIEIFLNLTPYIQEENFVFDNNKGFFCINDNIDLKQVSCMGPNKGS